MITGLSSLEKVIIPVYADIYNTSHALITIVRVDESLESIGSTPLAVKNPLPDIVVSLSSMTKSDGKINLT
jgi:Ca2+/Na+ antiporter